MDEMAQPQGALTENANNMASSMTEEQKNDLEELVLTGMHVIYAPKGSKRGVLKQAIKSGNTNKVKNTTDALNMIVPPLEAKREASGKPPYSDEVKLMGASYLTKQLIGYAEKNPGIKPYTPQESQAVLKGVIQTYITKGIKNRTIDAKTVAQAAERLQPGSISNALAEVPDDIKQGGGRQMPGKKPQGTKPQGMPGAKPPGGGAGMPPQQGKGMPPGMKPPGGKTQQPQQPQGLLKQPSPLEGFLKQRGAI